MTGTLVGGVSSLVSIVVVAACVAGVLRLAFAESDLGQRATPGVERGTARDALARRRTRTPTPGPAAATAGGRVRAGVALAALLAALGLLVGLAIGVALVAGDTVLRRAAGA